MTNKTIFISLRCSEEFKQALDDYISQKSLSRSTFIVQAIRSAMGVVEQEMVEAAPRAADLGGIMRRLSSLEGRVAALECEGHPEGEKPVAAMDAETLQIVEDLRDTGKFDDAWLTLADAFRKLGSDPDDPTSTFTEPRTGKAITFKRFRTNTHLAYYEKLGFECDQVRRSARKPWLRVRQDGLPAATQAGVAAAG